MFDLQGLARQNISIAHVTSLDVLHQPLLGEPDLSITEGRETTDCHQKVGMDLHVSLRFSIAVLGKDVLLGLEVRLHEIDQLSDVGSGGVALNRSDGSEEPLVLLIEDVVLDIEGGVPDERRRNIEGHE